MTDSACKTLERFVIDGVALDTDPAAAASGVTFCFTERIGGVSPAPFASLNLGAKGGDDPANVMENRRRVLAALGAADLLDGLIVPNQVHGDTVALVEEGTALPDCLESGADAVVCTAPGRAVMLLFADCLPVVLVGPGGFAVAHSGWRGTLAGIAGKTARALAAACRCDPGELTAYIGPHISGEVYEVSSELLASFSERFGVAAQGAPGCLDLAACVRASLAEAGVPAANVVDAGLCTARLTDRFFSHRAEQGRTGRHAALAFMGDRPGNIHLANPHRP